MMRIFIDTNILLDLMLRREPFYAKAQLIYQLGVWGDVELFVSDLTIVNCMCIAMRQKVALDNIYDFMQEMRKHIFISGIGEEVIDKAINAKSKDFEDIVQYYSAQNCNADYVVTRNKNDFPNDIIPVIEPEDMVGMFYEIN